MANELEIISHNQMHDFRLFLVNLVYRTPHVHKDLEICLILRGNITLYTPGRTYAVPERSFLILNPFQAHELKADQGIPALILSVQIAPAFFMNTYPQVQSMQITTSVHHISESPRCNQLFSMLIKLADHYLRKSDAYELLCTGLINTILYEMIQLCGYRIVSDAERDVYREQQLRIHRISDYIDAHYTGKLLLSDIAAEMDLSLYYLSHFFKENFGISFQEYLARIRSEKARQLLLLTSLSLLDISMSVGFSDPKYMNAAFRRLYGCSPKEYRRQFHHAPLPSQQVSMLTTQEFLSEEASLVLLEESMHRTSPHA